MINSELVMDLRAEIMKIAGEEVKKAIEEQREPKREESGSISCVDAVQVVRCKDCKNWHESMPEMGQCTLNPSWWTRPNGFCNYAEEK